MSRAGSPARWGERRVGGGSAGAPVGAGRLSPGFTALLTRRWAAAWGVLLAGLAIGGRGFAYIGLPPLFISELVVVTGVGVLLLQPRWRELLSQPAVLLTVGLLGWGLMRTLPYLGAYRVDAVRDYMIVGYATVGVAVAGVFISRPALLPWVLERYQGYAKVFLVVMPGLWVIDHTVSESIPRWPWADVPIVNLKPGDMPVHLGGIAALSLLGLFRGRSVGWTLLLVALLSLAGAVSRGGLVAFSVGFAVAFAARPTGAWARRVALVVAVLFGTALVTDVSVAMSDRDREFSARQLVLNFASIFSNDDTGDLDDTKSWRLDWWGQIVGYTFGGEYFWTGKGFGVNLADADGFQVMADHSLRSPHNGHLTILARAGVPGLLLWCGIQAAWLTGLVNAYLTTRRRGGRIDAAWGRWFVLLLAYWTALMFNAAVDVYFEGPMGGIWYWSVIGLGVASVYLYRHHPEVLDTPAAATGDSR